MKSKKEKAHKTCDKYEIFSHLTNFDYLVPMSKSGIFIGIDPDVELNGYALWHSNSKILEVGKETFWDIIEDIEDYKKDNVPLTVIIEAGWLIPKSNWHGAKSKGTAAKIGKNVGSNHQVGRLLEAYCIHNKIPHRLTKPQGKVKAEYFKKLTGYQGRTNQDMRDAGLLVFNM